MKQLLLAIGLLLILAAEILRVYFIMPFPGSQHANTIGFAYWLDRNILWIRCLALLMIVFPAVQVFGGHRLWKKLLLGLVLAFYLFIFFVFNYRFEADRMFYQPRNKNFAGALHSSIDTNRLVIGVVINGETKAYPIQLIGYHHQVRDTVGKVPVMITYCTVCRTGRVFSPQIDAKPETFRLVGMDHFNAMFEDATTHTWWQQATGKAIAGPLKGAALTEIPSRQATLAAWLRQYPESLILQPDTLFGKDYDDLAAYDKGTLKSSLEKRDSGSWQKKSWVIGVQATGHAKAYDWNRLTKEKIIQDSLPGLPLLLVLEKDTSTFHTWNRTVNGQVLRFDPDIREGIFMDTTTGSSWDLDGTCTAGPLKGQQLVAVQSYQEFWHSWSTFHPNTTK